MATVTTSFVSDDKDVHAALLRMTADYAKLREENRKLVEQSKQSAAATRQEIEEKKKLAEQTKKAAQEAKKAAEEQERHAEAWSSGLNEISGSLAGNLVQLTSLAGAVGTVKDAYADWYAEMVQAAEKSKSFHRDLARELALSGDLKQAPKVEQFLRSVPTASRDEIAAAYRGARGELPTGDLDRDVLPVAGAAARAAPILQDAGEIEKLSSAAAVIGDVYKDKNAQQAVDLAHQFRVNLGGHKDDANAPGVEKALAGFQAAGLGAEESLAFLQQALGAEVPTRTLAGFASRLNENITPGKTASEAEQRLAKVKGASRFRLLMNDPAAMRAFVGEEAGAAFGTISREGVAEQAEAFRAAQLGGGAVSRDLGDVPAGVAADRRSDLEVRNAEERVEGSVKRHQRATQMLEAEIKDKTFWQQFQARNNFAIKYHASRVFGSSEEEAEQAAFRTAFGYGPGGQARGKELGAEFARREQELMQRQTVALESLLEEARGRRVAGGGQSAHGER